MIICYLDSQDYSTLTDPKLNTPEQRQTKSTLLHFAHSKQVIFAFSAVSVCESVSLSADATYLAELKAELLSELCGSNALVSFDRLIEAELKTLAHKADPQRDMLDPDGKWFPEISIDENPQSYWEIVRREAEDELKTMGLSRQQRRVHSRALIKNGKPRPTFSAHLAQQNPSSLATEILKKYPMRPEYAETIARYGLGRASGEEFSDALMKSLKDPRWMMKWFTTQHSLSSPIAEIVRKPGRELGQAMRSLVEISTLWAKILRNTSLNTDPTGKNGPITSLWNNSVNQQLITATTRMADTASIKLEKFSPGDVDTYCPGISTLIRSMFSSVWENVGGSRKEQPSDSQPVDAIHALYAPYVTVFRADRFMTPHIQRQVLSAGTTVVPRLSQLITTLSKQLS